MGLLVVGVGGQQGLSAILVAQPRGHGHHVDPALDAEVGEPVAQVVDPHVAVAELLAGALKRPLGREDVEDGAVPPSVAPGVQDGPQAAVDGDLADLVVLGAGFAACDGDPLLTDVLPAQRLGLGDAQAAPREELDHGRALIGAAGSLGADM